MINKQRTLSVSIRKENYETFDKFEEIVGENELEKTQVVRELIYNFVKDYEEKRIEFIKSKELEIIEEETRNLEFFDKKKYPIVNEYILPAKKAGGRFAMFPFKYMKVGESFYVPLIDFKSCKNKKRPLTCLMQRIYRMLQYQQEKNYVKKTKRFTTREVAEKGVRVWRIK